MLSKRIAEEVQNSSLPKSFQERVHMLKSAGKTLLISFEKITVLTVILSLISAGAAFAAAGGIPGRPTPPPPPCIATGLIEESNFDAVGCYLCNVRNVGATSHQVTIDIRDTGNLTDSANIAPITLAPGHTSLFSFCPPDNQTSGDACVVTTVEGTTDALEDLAVVLQFSTPASETEGKIFNSCATRSGVANNP